jgi:hypothetical protein
MTRFTQEADWEDHGTKTAQAKSYRDPISTNKLNMVVGTMISANRMHIGRRILFQGWPQVKTQDPIQKITKAKKGWGA